MKNMNRISAYTLGLLLVMSVFGCTNLDEEIKGSFTKDFDPSNIGIGKSNNVTNSIPTDGLQGAFGKLYAGTATNGGFFAVQEGGTDEAVITQKGGDWYDGGLYILIHQHKFSPQTWAINDTWNQGYDGVLQCNTLLQQTDLTAEDVGQLEFLKAYFLWRLMDVFGNIKIPETPGVDVAQAESTATLPLRPVAYHYIVNLLLDAADKLPDGKQAYARANKDAAYALLSRIYLNSGVYLGSGNAEYQKAIDAADVVINSGFYDLASDYAAMFAPDNAQNASAATEFIFVVPFDENTGTGETWAEETLHYPSQLTWKLQDQPWNGFATLEDFYNSYDDNDARKTANFIVGPQYDYDGNPLLDLAYDKADPDGAPLNYTPHINELFPNSSRQAGARFGKFSFKIGQHDDMDNDFPILRYAEVLMNKAEAEARLNGTYAGDPTTLVNEIRARAGADPITGLDDIKMLAERGREFFVEGFRRTDLIRFGKYGSSWWEFPGDAASNAGGNHTIMAIPIEAIQESQTSTFKLKQNPGY